MTGIVVQQVDQTKREPLPLKATLAERLEAAKKKRKATP